MKKLMTAAVLVLFSAPAAFAANGTWTGKIGDSMCGLTHKAMIDHSGGKITTDAQCTDACIKGGAKYVFTSGGKVYMIANQDNPGLAKYAGENVKVMGKKDGDTITISKISKAS